MSRLDEIKAFTKKQSENENTTLDKNGQLVDDLKNELAMLIPQVAELNQVLKAYKNTLNDINLVYGNDFVLVRVSGKDSNNEPDYEVSFADGCVRVTATEVIVRKPVISAELFLAQYNFLENYIYLQVDSRIGAKSKEELLHMQLQSEFYMVIAQWTKAKEQRDFEQILSMKNRLLSFEQDQEQLWELNELSEATQQEMRGAIRVFSNQLLTYIREYEQFPGEWDERLSHVNLLRQQLDSIYPEVVRVLALAKARLPRENGKIEYRNGNVRIDETKDGIRYLHGPIIADENSIRVSDYVVSFDEFYTNLKQVEDEIMGLS